MLLRYIWRSVGANFILYTFVAVAVVIYGSVNQKPTDWALFMISVFCLYLFFITTIDVLRMYTVRSRTSRQIIVQLKQCAISDEELWSIISAASNHTSYQSFNDAIIYLIKRKIVEPLKYQNTYLYSLTERRRPDGMVIVSSLK